MLRSLPAHALAMLSIRHAIPVKKNTMNVSIVSSQFYCSRSGALTGLGRFFSFVSYVGLRPTLESCALSGLRHCRPSTRLLSYRLLAALTFNKSPQQDNRPSNQQPATVNFLRLVPCAAIPLLSLRSAKLLPHSRSTNVHERITDPATGNQQLATFRAHSSTTILSVNNFPLTVPFTR
jgi:hypothetical protein